MPPHGYRPEEYKLLRSLSTPEKVQEFLDSFPYNKEPGGPTVRSPRMALHQGSAHCMEGALIAAAALEAQGLPPLLMDLEAVRDDDHVVALYRAPGGWGAVAKSNYSGLRFRSPVYRTLRELAISYFEHYFNPRGEKTLRAHSRPVNLRRFNRIGWRTAEGDVWEIPTFLADIAHTPLLNGAAVSRRYHMDKRLYEAGRLGMVK